MDVAAVETDAAELVEAEVADPVDIANFALAVVLPATSHQPPSPSGRQGPVGPDQRPLEHSRRDLCTEQSPSRPGRPLVILAEAAKEIARDREIPPDTVKTRLHRGRARPGRALGEEEHR